MTKLALAFAFAILRVMNLLKSRRAQHLFLCKQRVELQVLHPSIFFMTSTTSQPSMSAISFKKWTIRDPIKGFDSLEMSSGICSTTLGDHDILVNFKAVSLNYRDIVIAKVRR